MVCCENLACPAGLWFHLVCIGLDRPPAESELFICNVCEKLVSCQPLLRRRAETRPSVEHTNETLNSLCHNTFGDITTGFDFTLCDATKQTATARAIAESLQRADEQGLEELRFIAEKWKHALAKAPALPQTVLDALKPQ